MLSAEVLSVTADARVVLADGEQSWIEGGFGKLRYGGNPTDSYFAPELAEANLIWQPRLNWSISATVVGTVQKKQELEAGLSEAFLVWKPLGKGSARVSARAGLFYPPISLEHDGPEWAVAETITPSAINSWIGEEVKVIGIEATIATRLGNNGLRLTGALFDANETAGTLLAFRGWSLHDEKALAFRTQPLPPLDTFFQTRQRPVTTPILTINGQHGKGGFARQLGSYLKLAWEPSSLPVRLELLHYDNRATPHFYTLILDWGWRTRFDHLGLVANLGPATQLRAQGIRGNTRMGMKVANRFWVDTDFRSAFALLTHRFERTAVSARIEAFGTRNHGGRLGPVEDEDGWAVTLAARRALGAILTGFVEVVHVESTRQSRHRIGTAPFQAQTQIQAALRLKW